MSLCRKSQRRGTESAGPKSGLGSRRLGHPALPCLAFPYRGFGTRPLSEIIRCRFRLSTYAPIRGLSNVQPTAGNIHSEPMFENLQEKLQRAFKSLRGQARLSEENIAEALREIRLALLEADVNFKVVKELIDRIQAKAVGQEVLTALSPGEQVIKIVRDELVEILGKDTARVKFASQPPTVVLMAGLQGSGKTTTSGKLANWFKNGGHRPLLVSVEVYRPAAREQLRVVAQAINAHIYEGQVGEANSATVERLVKEARKEAINTGCDVLIVDTAGRLHIDEQLMDEMQSLKKLLNPQEILFVADSMTGQDAVNSADEFHKKLALTG